MTNVLEGQVMEVGKLFHSFTKNRLSLYNRLVVIDEHLLEAVCLAQKLSELYGARGVKFPCISAALLNDSGEATRTDG